MQPAVIDIVRRAYALWENAGRPEGRDQEFYLEAERELRGNSRGDAPPDSPSPAAKQHGS